MTDAGHYHLHLHNISRTSGHNIHAAVAYRHGTRTSSIEAAAAYRHARVHGSGDTAFDYRSKVGVECFGIVAPDDVPAWMRDPTKLWRAVDAWETRKNARLARELIIALPHQLDTATHIELLTAFVKRHCVDPYRLIADIAIHAPPVKNGGDPRNWHAHVLMTDRPAGPDGFLRTKDRRTQSKLWLSELREGWAKLHNERMQALGLPVRIDHRTLKAQHDEALARGDTQAAVDLDRLPQIHVGKAVHASHPRYAAYADRRDRNATVLRQNADRIDRLNERADAELVTQRQRAFIERRYNAIIREERTEPNLAELKAIHGRPVPRTFLGRLHTAAIAGEARDQALKLSRAAGHLWRHTGHYPEALSIWDALVPTIDAKPYARNPFTVTAKDIAFAFYSLGFINIRELQTTLDRISSEQQQRRADRESRRMGKLVVPPPPRERPDTALPTPERHRLRLMEQQKAHLMVIAAKRHGQEQAHARRMAWVRSQATSRAQLLAVAQTRVPQHERGRGRARTRTDPAWPTDTT